MITNDNRKEIAQAIAKAIAFKNCGKEDLAAFWAVKLIETLELTNILNDKIKHNGSTN